MMVTALFHQGTEENVRLLSGRIMLLATLLAGNLQYTLRKRKGLPWVVFNMFPLGDLTLQFLSANLVSHLSLEKESQNFRGIKDVRRLGLDLYVRGSTASFDNFARY